jgi:tetratricopeptide (TPR) repeat protein
MRWRDAVRSSLFPLLGTVQRTSPHDACHQTPCTSLGTPSGRLRRALVVLLPILLPVLLSVLLSHGLLNSVQAQGDAPLLQMAELIDNGFFTIAAQEEGPRLLEQLPNHPQAHYLYSYALYRTGNTQQARDALERAMALQGTPADPRHEWLLGLLLAATGDLAGSQALLARVFEESGFYRVAMDWGRVAWQRGDYVSALEAFVAAGQTEEGMREPWPFLNQGRLLMQLQRYEEAVDAFNTAITVYEAVDTAAEELPSPAYVESYYRLGEVYELLGDVEQAANYYGLARVADPLYMPAANALDRLKASTPP